MQLAKEYDLWVIEDNCDAFGSEYAGKKTGSFAHLSTISFYPAHHITTGEGGAICTNDPQLALLVRAFRDWGRDCYCAGGENNTCGKRFSQQFGELPFGFDHKYVYSEIGYNLKMTDIQAAIGAAQIEKLPFFCERRKENFKEWFRIFSKYSEYFILPEPTQHSDPRCHASGSRSNRDCRQRKTRSPFSSSNCRIDLMSNQLQCDAAGTFQCLRQCAGHSTSRGRGALLQRRTTSISSRWPQAQA